MNLKKAQFKGANITLAILEAIILLFGFPFKLISSIAKIIDAINE